MSFAEWKKQKDNERKAEASANKETNAFIEWRDNKRKAEASSDKKTNAFIEWRDSERGQAAIAARAAARSEALEDYKNSLTLDRVLNGGRLSFSTHSLARKAFTPSENPYDMSYNMQTMHNDIAANMQKNLERVNEERRAMDLDSEAEQIAALEADIDAVNKARDDVQMYKDRQNLESRNPRAYTPPSSRGNYNKRDIYGEGIAAGEKTINEIYAKYGVSDISELENKLNYRRSNYSIASQLQAEDMLAYDTAAGQEKIDSLSSIKSLAKSIAEDEGWLSNYDAGVYDGQYESAEQLRLEAERRRAALDENTAAYKALFADNGFEEGDLKAVEKEIGRLEKYHKNAVKAQNEEADRNEYEQIVSSAKSDPHFATYSQRGANIENPWHMPFTGDGNVVEYSRENEIPIRFRLSFAGDYLYSRMSEDEVDVYNYLLGKGDEERAERYLELLEKTLEYREASAHSNTWNNNIGEPFYNLGAGVESFGTNVSRGVYNLITGSEEEIEPSVWQQASQMMRSDNEGAWKMVNDAVYSTGNMLPSIGASALVGLVNPAAGVAVGNVLMGASSAGGAYNEMISLGYNADQARAYGLLVGGTEVATQYLLGGIGKLGGKTVTALAPKLNGAMAKLAITNPKLVTAANLGLSAASEGVEEAISAALEPIYKAYATGEDFEGIDMEEVLYSALLGAFTGGMIEGAPIVANAASSSVSKRINAAAEAKAAKSQTVGEIEQTDIEDAPETDDTSFVDRSIDEAELEAELMEQAMYDYAYEMANQGDNSYLKSLRAGDGAGETRYSLRGVNENNIEVYETSGEIKKLPVKENKKVKASPSLGPTEWTSKSDAQRLYDNSISQNGELVKSAVDKKLTEGMSAHAIDAMRSGIEAVGEKYAADFAIDFRSAYRAGRIGVPLSAMSVSESSIMSSTQREAAYRLGAEDTKAETASKQAAINAQREAGISSTQAHSKSKRSRVHVSRNVQAGKEIQKTSTAALDIISRALDIDIYVYDSKKPVSEDERISNGWYDERDNSIHIDISAGRNGQGTMLFALSHEITHYIKRWSPAKYDAFAKFLVERYCEAGVDVDVLVSAQIDKAARQGYTITESEAFDEVIADSCERMLLDSDALSKLSEFASANESNRSIVEKIRDCIRKYLTRLRELYKNKQVSSDEAVTVSEMTDTAEKLYRLFEDALVDAAEASRAVGETYEASGDVRYSFAGVADDGKKIYKGNFPKGTPKAAKSEKILDYIKNVWSRKPIRLVISNGETSRAILAKFDPTVDKSGNTHTDATKIAGGNRHGTSSEQRVTLDLADDYYEIASEASYNYSKLETGKDASTHDGVIMWHYFVNDIYFTEYGENTLVPYTVTINVKEKNDGNYVYSFSAEKEPSTRRTLHADVNTYKGANGELFIDNSISQNGDFVKSEISPSDDGSREVGAESGVKYSRKNVKAQIDSVLDGTFPRGNAVYLGATPSILAKVGLNGELPLLTTARHISNANKPKNTKKHHHGLSRNQLKNIPEKLASPVMVMDSLDSASNSVIVVTDMLDSDGSPIIATVRADGRGMYNDVEIDTNFVTSYYGRDSFAHFLKDIIDADNVLYINKEKAIKLSAESNSSWFEQLNAYDFDTIIHQTKAHVNISGEKFSDVFSDVTVSDDGSREVGAESGVKYSRKSLGAEFSSEIDEWNDNGKPRGETFVFGTTGNVLQGLGAIESDIYMHGDKIKTILSEHTEMTLDEIKRIPQILENPVLILKSKGIGTDKKANTRLVIFGTAKAKDGLPILSVLDLRPVEGNFVVDDMQKVVSAYTKDVNPADFIMSSDVLYVSDNEKVAARLLRTIGLQSRPIELNRSGYIGSISYDGQKVNISGEKFSDVFFDMTVSDDGNTDDIRHSLKDPNEVSDRAALVETLKAGTTNPVVKDKLDEWAANIEKMDAEDEKLRSLKAQIREISFSKGERDMAKLRSLREEATKTQNRISNYDRKLLNIEGMEPIKRLFETERKRTRDKAYSVALENAKRVRTEKLEAQRAYYREYYSEMRKRDRSRRYATETRGKLKRVIADIRKPFNHPTKKRNIKEGMRGFADKALSLADALFSEQPSNAEIAQLDIRSLTDTEEVQLAQYRELLRERDGMNSVSEKGYDEESAGAEITSEAVRARIDLERRINELEGGALADLFARERKGLQKMKVGKVLGEISLEYGRLKNDTDEYISNAYNKEVHEMLKGLVSDENISDKTVREMSEAEIQKVYNAFVAIRQTIRNANKFFTDIINDDISSTSHRLMRELSVYARRVKGKLIDAVNSGEYAMLKPIYAIRRMGSKTLEKLFSALRSAEDKWASDVKEAATFLNEQKKKHNYDKWDRSDTYRFTTATGLAFELELGEIMSLYAYSKRQHAEDHVNVGGIVPKNSKKKLLDTSEYKAYKKRIDKLKEANKDGEISDVLTELELSAAPLTGEATAYMLNEALFNEITSKLTAEQRAFVDETQAYLSDVMGAKGNEVSMKLYGIKLFTEDFYFPLKSAREYMKAELDGKTGEVRIKNKGMTKELVPHANNPIVLDDYLDVWAGHVDEMSMYHAFVLPMEDITRVYNYKLPSSAEYDANSVKAQLQNAQGKAATEYIEKLITDLNGGVRTEGGGLASTLVSKGKKASVMASLSVAIQQPTAIVRAMAYINPIYFAGHRRMSASSAPKTFKAVQEELERYCPIAIIKRMGRFDAETGRSTVDFIVDDKNVLDRIDSATGWLSEKADEVTWHAIWRACKNEAAAKNKSLKNNNDALCRAAASRFNEVITMTQVYDSVLSRSQIMRSKNELNKMATSFMAEPTTIVNMLYDAVVQAIRGDKKQLARIIPAVVVSIVVNEAAAAVIYAARDDDEDETYLEKYLQALTSGLLDSAIPLTYIPYAADLWNLLQGYDIERADMGLISDFVNAVGKCFSEPGEVESYVNLTTAAANFFGVPAKNIIRDAKGIANFFKTLVNGPNVTALGTANAVCNTVRDWVPFSSYSYTKTDELYDAITGDEAHAKRMKETYKDDASYETAVKNALREHDERIREAAKEYIDGDASRLISVTKKIVGEGNFDGELVEGAIRAEVRYYNDKIKDGANALIDGKDDEYKKAVKALADIGYDRSDIERAVTAEANAVKRGVTTLRSAGSDIEGTYYTTSDIGVILDSGDTAHAKRVIDELIEVKAASGSKKADARTSIKSALTRHYKDTYLSANDAERKRIRKALWSTGLYKNIDEVIELVQGWIKDNGK